MSEDLNQIYCRRSLDMNSNLSLSNLFYIKNRFKTLINQKTIEIPGAKSYSGDLGNVPEACYQETAIKKRRFRTAGSPITSFLLICGYTSLFANLTMVSCHK